MSQLLEWILAGVFIVLVVGFYWLEYHYFGRKDK